MSEQPTVEGNEISLTDKISLNHLLLEHSQWRAKCRGDFLDSKLVRPSRSCLAQSYISPLLCGLSQASGMAILFLFGILYLYFGFISLLVILEGYAPVADPNSIKITNLRTANVPLEVGLVNLQIRTKCDLSSFSNVVQHPVSISGFTITVNWDSNVTCPGPDIFFTLQASQGSNGSLYDIGASTVRWTAFGPRPVDNGVGACAGPVSISYLPPWPWHLTDQACLHSFLLGSALLIAGLCCAAHHPRAAKYVLVAALVISGLLLCIASLGFLSLGLDRYAFSPAISGTLLVLLALALSHHERRLAEAVLACGGLLLVVRALDDCALFRDCAFLASQPPATPATAAFLGLTLLLLRHVKLARLRAAFIRDRARYDAAWTTLTGSRADCAALDVLDAEMNCPELAAACMAERPQQRFRHFSTRGAASSSLLPPDHSTADAESHQRVGSGRRVSVHSGDFLLQMADASSLGAYSDSDLAVVSLDQLYSQASSSKCACGGVVVVVPGLSVKARVERREGLRRTAKGERKKGRR